MPPSEKFKQLPQEEIDVIKAWIQAGAVAGEAVAVAPAAAAPEVNEQWAESPVSALAWSPDGRLVARGGLRTVCPAPNNTRCT